MCSPLPFVSVSISDMEENRKDEFRYIWRRFVDEHLVDERLVNGSCMDWRPVENEFRCVEDGWTWFRGHEIS
ncbi:hypothetical protein N665_0011s0029 [Sinapis alba]|nr:hypothetical protein N665_0011s0029 [Sinapis alba]